MLYGKVFLLSVAFWATLLWALQSAGVIWRRDSVRAEQVGINKEIRNFKALFATR